MKLTQKKKLLIKRVIKVIFILILPIVLSLVFFSPFSTYEINERFIRNLTATPEKTATMTYNLQIGELNTTEVENYLVTSYIERVFNIFTKYQRYNLYFADKSIKDKPKQATIYFVISTVDGTFNVKRFGTVKSISNIDLTKKYNVNLTINTMLQMMQGDKYENITNEEYLAKYGDETYGGLTSYYTEYDNKTCMPITYIASTGDIKEVWYLKKSFSEFLIKLTFFILLWNVIIIQGVKFIYESLFKGKA